MSVSTAYPVEKFKAGWGIILFSSRKAHWYERLEAGNLKPICRNDGEVPARYVFYALNWQDKCKVCLRHKEESNPGDCGERGVFKPGVPR